jgi:hypothetical protein
MSETPKPWWFDLSRGAVPPRPSKGFVISPHTVVLGEEEIYHLNKVGGVTLSPEHCDALTYWLGVFSVYFQLSHTQKLSPAAKRKFEQFRKRCDDLLKELEKVDPAIVHWLPESSDTSKASLYIAAILRTEAVDHANLVQSLQSLSDAIKDTLAERSKPGRPKVGYFMRKFMTEVSVLYKLAGGSSILVSRGDSQKRKSRFVEFAWALLQLIPKDKRPAAPSSLDAMTAWWEKNTAARQVSAKTQ